MRNRYSSRAALIGALCAVSACQSPAAIDPGPAQQTASMPTAGAFSLRVSSGNAPRADHYEVPLDFDGDVASHPYTSGLGPCPDGGMGARCPNTIPPSHYNR
jgi:hypothetical protein